MSLFNELKRRNVFRVGAAYAIFAWVLIQIIDTVLPTFDAPRWIIQTVTFLIILGFPVTLFLSWVFELTPEGIKKDAEALTDKPRVQSGAGDFSKVKSNTLNAMILGLLVLAVGFLLIDRYAIVDSPASPEASAISQNQDETQNQADTLRLSIVLPWDEPMMLPGTPQRSLAISPDGRTVVYTSRITDPEGDADHRLSVRELDALQTRPLPGTENAHQPFFSPDGQWVGFFTTDGNLKKVSLAGGRPVTLLEGINGGRWTFSTWLANDMIVFGDSASRILTAVSADGGETTPLTTLNETAGELNHNYPVAVTGTNKVLFQAVRQIENRRIQSIEALDTSTGERRRILDNAGSPTYVDGGYLILKQDEVILVAPFDPEQLTFSGQAVSLLDNIGTDRRDIPQYAVSANNTLVYAPQRNDLSELRLINPDGNSELLDIRAEIYNGISVSPDGRYGAFEVGIATENETRIYDFERQTTRVLSEAETDHSAFWHPDSNALVTASTNAGIRGLWLKSLDGGERLLIETEAGSPGLRNGSWHPDGRRLAITRQFGNQHDIMLLILEENESISLEPLVTGEAEHHSPRISPDGKWLAYVSSRSGDFQVYIRRFPDGEELIASTGWEARGPRWNADGTALSFFQSDDGALFDQQMVSVTVTEVNNRLEVSRPRTLFPLVETSATGIIENYVVGFNAGPMYDVMPDGRFLMAKGRARAFHNELVVVRNWLTEVQAK